MTDRAPMRIALAAALATAPVPAAAQQPAPVAPAAPAAAVPSFPPGADYAGVAGSAEENARIAKVCGAANRNAKDGYFAPPATPGQTRAPILKGSQPVVVEVVATLDRSIGMTFLPGGDMLVTQRAGGMRIVSRDGAVSEPLKGAPAIRQVGLSASSDVVLDKGFARNRTLYYGFVAQPDAPGGPSKGRIIKARLSDDARSLESIVVLHEAADLVPRRLVLARDGTLLVASAEVLSGGPAPQSLTSEKGKVLRIGTDGVIPRDNPFRSDAKADPALYAVGFRDVQAAALDPRTGELWVGEDTPMGGDELNRVRPGRNYGFPLISYGRENSGALINGGKTVQEGLEQPVYYWTPSIAPSGMAFYTGDKLRAWKGSLFVGSMSGKQLVRLSMRDGKVVGEEKLLMDRCKRIKDVRQGPDGFVYVLTDETPSEVLRLKPAPGGR